MTENEAIKHCEERAKKCDKCGEEHKQLAEWIKELLKYREIGTVEECREAVEKQRGMQVNEIHVDEYFCPACGSENNNGDIGCPGDNYCPKCGQAIYY